MGILTNTPTFLCPDRLGDLRPILKCLTSLVSVSLKWSGTVEAICLSFHCIFGEFVSTHCFLLFHLEFACVLQLERVQERLADRKIKIQVTDAAVQFLGELGYDPNYGARPVKQVIQQYIENELGKCILRGEFKEEDTVLIDTDVTASSDGQLPQQKLVLKRLEPDSDTSAAENREALSQTQ